MKVIIWHWSGWWQKLLNSVHTPQLAKWCWMHILVTSDHKQLEFCVFISLLVLAVVSVANILRPDICCPQNTFFNQLQSFLHEILIMQYCFCLFNWVQFVLVYRTWWWSTFFPMNYKSHICLNLHHSDLFHIKTKLQIVHSSNCKNFLSGSIRVVYTALN